MKFESNRVTVSALELRALAAFASKDAEHHPNLSAVWFDLGARCAWATDGYTAVAYVMSRRRRATSHCVHVPVCDVPSLLALCKLSPSKSVIVGTDVLDGVDLLQADLFRVPVERGLFPRAGAAGAAFVWSWNAALVARVALVQRAADTTHVDVFAPDGPMDPTLFRVGQWRAVIMPCVGHEHEKRIAALDARNAELGVGRKARGAP